MGKHIKTEVIPNQKDSIMRVGQFVFHCAHIEIHWKPESC